MPLDFLIIGNPTSGRRRATAMAQAVLEQLRAAGRSAELKTTSAPGDAKRLAAEAVQAGVPCVVGCGGDGTLQEIASALAQTETVMGILPGGRCNDLARALGIQRSDALATLAAMLLNGPVRKIDLGVCVPLTAMPGQERRVFCTVATLGFDSEVTKFVLSHRFPLKGTAEYLHATVRVLARFHPPRVRLTGSFGKFEGPILLAATGNSSSYGGALQIAPGALIDDGLLDLCLVRAVSKLTLLRILPKVFKGRHLSHPAVSLQRTTNVQIEPVDGPLTICADGEILGQTPAQLEVLPMCLNVKTK